MKTRLALATLFALTLAQVPGCHFYVRATPEIIISDQPFVIPQPPTPTLQGP
jgi:hypothetical protein